MANRYDVGDVVRCTGTFTTSAGVATDPSVVKCAFRLAGSTATTYTYGTDAQLVKSTTGIYYVDISATSSGAWWYRFYSTGTGQGSEETYFFVDESHF